MTGPTALEVGRFEQALLRAAREEVAPRDALRRSAAALGVSLPVIGLAALEMTLAGGTAQATTATGALATTEAVGVATSTQAGAVALGTSLAGVAGATTSVSQPIAAATLALLAKHVGAGVVAGAIFAGGAHQATKAFDASAGLYAETPAFVQTQPASRSAPARRGLVGGRQAAVDQTEQDATASDVPFRDAAAFAAAPGPRTGVASTGASIGGRVADATEAAEMSDGAADPTAPDALSANVASFPTEPPAKTDPKAKPESVPELVGLELERLLIGRAQRALAHGRPLVALRDLGMYSAQCKSGQLRAQANLIRVEALLRTGQRDMALWVARQEIERSSTRATVERMREMFQAQGDPQDRNVDAGKARQASEKD